MQLFTLQSKSEQVADAIKKQIISGKVLPGAKLNSVRELANNFKVSTKIVVGALDILEQEQLVKREAGRGVFARSYSAGSNIEVCLLTWNVDLKIDKYFSDLVKMSYPPYLQDGFNFTVRTVPFSRELKTSHFTQELQRFDKMLHADCLVINAPNLDSAKIKACLKINTPVIFIGDFSHGLDPDIPFNQVTADNASLGENCVRKLYELKQPSEIVMYSPSLEHYFSRMMCNGALNAASNLNTKLHIIDMPRGFSKLEQKQKDKVFAERTEIAGISDFQNIPAINGGIFMDFLKRQIKHGGCCKNVYFQENSDSYIKRFYDAIFAQVKRVADNPKETRKIVLKEDFEDFSLKKL